MRGKRIWHVVIACVLVLLTVGVGAGQEAKLPDGLRHVPLDAVGFLHIRAGDFLKTDIGKTMLQELTRDPDAKTGLKKVEQALGVELADIESVTVIVLGQARSFFNPLNLIPKKQIFKEKFDDLKKPDFKYQDFKFDDKKFDDKKFDDKKFDDKKFDDKKFEQSLSTIESMVALQENPFFPQNGLDPRFPFQDMDRLGFGGAGSFSPLVIVTCKKPINRKKILQAQFQIDRLNDPLGLPADLSIVFLSDHCVLAGQQWDVAYYNEVVARRSKTQPMKAALELAAKPHMIVAGGHVPADLRFVMASPFANDLRKLAPLSPLFLTDMGLTLDFGKSIDLNVQLHAPNEVTAANALQAMKTLRVMTDMFIDEKVGEAGKGADWQRELHQAISRALADATLEQDGKTVRAQLKLDVGPEFYKRFSKEIVDNIRRKSDRVQSANNLKQIGVAIHSYHDAYKRLPPAASSSIKNRDGKPLLSWRVAILPFIEQLPLYNQFDLDKPWDHPTNKKLIGMMPPIYALPGTDSGKGLTHYRTFVGPDTMLEPIKGPDGRLMARYKLFNIPDGTSNTIMVVESAEPTIWTRPDDLPYDPKGPLPKLGTSPEGFLVLLGDGSVRFVRSTVSEATLRAAITCSDGVPLGADWDN